MNVSLISRSLFAVLAAASLATVVPSRGADVATPARVDILHESGSATVASINQETRTVTLQFADDSIEQFVVGPEVKRLNEVVAGDKVVVDYVTALGFELRAPTAAEMAEPFVELVGAEKTALGELPAGAIGRAIRAVTTIEILDRIHGTATVKGPQGNQLTIVVKDPANLSKVRIGETVVVTYAEAVVVSLEKQVAPATK